MGRSLSSLSNSPLGSPLSSMSQPLEQSFGQPLESAVVALSKQHESAIIAPSKDDLEQPLNQHESKAF